MNALFALRDRNPRLVVGLMSGTSCDGVDVAFVELTRHDHGISFELRHYQEIPFEVNLRQRLLRLAEVGTARIDELCMANVDLARAYSDAIRFAASNGAIDLKQIDLIGSHGQTVHHLPDHGSTLQIGESAVLAEAFGVPVVADFRPADMAAGGQGAPLVPYVDYLLLRDPAKGRAIQNIGGIANVTYLPPNCEPGDVIAFDTGPGNMLVDALASRFSNGEMTYDQNGEMAEQGTVCQEFAEELLAHPYFEVAPPKSTGRELFGNEFVERLASSAETRGLSQQDVMATATAITVQSISMAYEKWLYPIGPVDEVIFSGGGVKNATMMSGLRCSIGDRSTVLTSDEIGLPSDAREAISFAILANETIDGRSGNLCAATGAKHGTILGKIVLPS